MFSSGTYLSLTIKVNIVLKTARRGRTKGTCEVDNPHWASASEYCPHPLTKGDPMMMFWRYLFLDKLLQG